MKTESICGYTRSGSGGIDDGKNATNYKFRDNNADD